jgi:uncharacterized protein YcfJ
MNSRFYPIDVPGLGKKLLGLTLTIALGACSNLHNDRTRTTAEGGLAGAAGGAALGAAAGAALGGKNKAKGALIGGAAGALAGGAAGTAYGSAVAGKKESYARTEDSLDAQIRAAKREIANRHTFNNGLRYEVARHQQRLASLQASDRAAGRAVEQFELRSTVATRIGELDREARSWQDTIDAHKAALQQYRNDPRAAMLRSDLDSLTAESADLARQRRELLSITRKAK